MAKKTVSDYLAELGRKGGKAGTGESKVRGDSEYYRKLRRRGAKKAKN